MADMPPDPDPFIRTAKRVMFAGAIIALVLIIGLLIQYLQMPPAVPPTPAPSTPQSTPQPTAAQISNAQEVTVAFHVSGTIDRMFFAEHAQVKQGDLLATLDKQPFEAAIDYAKAQIQAVQAQRNQPPNLSNHAFHAIEDARANVETAQHMYDVARAELEKRKKLIVPGQQDNVYNNDVQNEHDAALDLARAKRELAHQRDIAIDDADRDAYDSALQTARTNLAVAETNLAYTQLLAPADGIIIKRSAEIGDNVGSGEAVFTVAVAKGAGVP